MQNTFSAIILHWMNIGAEELFKKVSHYFDISQLDEQT